MTCQTCNGSGLQTRHLSPYAAVTRICPDCEGKAPAVERGETPRGQAAGLRETLCSETTMHETKGNEKG